MGEEVVVEEHEKVCHVFCAIYKLFTSEHILTDLLEILICVYALAFALLEGLLLKTWLDFKTDTGSVDENQL